jgi:mannose-6-phosphate isomerase class I
MTAPGERHYQTAGDAHARMAGRILTIEQAADFTGKTARQIDDLVRLGKLRYVIPVEALEALRK